MSGIHVVAGADLGVIIKLYLGDSTLGQIKVKVKNNQGHPIPAASMTMAATKGSFQASGATDQNGEYLYADIPPGEYKIMAAAGQGIHAVKNVRLGNKQIKEVNLTLR